MWGLKKELMQAERQTPLSYLISLFTRSNKLDGSDVYFFLLSFLSAWAGQASETVSLLKPDKVTRRIITNYLNNKSKERKFTPFNPQEKRRKWFLLPTLYLIVITITCQTVISVWKRRRLLSQHWPSLHHAINWGDKQH